MADGSLNIPLTNSDLYQTTNTTPNIVLQHLPSGAFEVTTKVTLPAAYKGYQQGGLVIYGDDNNYLKLVYSRPQHLGRGRQGSEHHPVRQGGQRHGVGDELRQPRRGLLRHRVAADVEHRRHLGDRLVQQRRRHLAPRHRCQRGA